MIDVLKTEVPSLEFGYFNRTKEHFRSQIANRTCRQARIADLNLKFEI
jgi:hypothetical protein